MGNVEESTKCGEKRWMARGRDRPGFCLEFMPWHTHWTVTETIQANKPFPLMLVMVFTQHWRSN